MLKRLANLITDSKVIAAFLLSVISIIILATIFAYSTWQEGQKKLGEFETLKAEVAELKGKDYVDLPALEARMMGERAAFVEAAAQSSESGAVGGQQGWNPPLTCPAGQYVAAVQFEGADAGVRYCVSCFVRAKVTCRPFPAP